MRLRVKCAVNALHKRKGPSTSHGVVGMLYKGDVIVVVEKKSFSNGDYWYKHEGSDTWSCGKLKREKGEYLVVVENLEKPPTDNKKPNVESDRDKGKDKNKPDYDKIQSAIGKGNKGRLAPYDVKPGFQFNTNGTIFKDNFKDASIGTINDSRKNRASGSIDNVINLDKDLSFIRDKMQAIRENLNLSGRFKSAEQLRQKLFTQCNRFNMEYPEDQLTKAFGFVFFTRPDLNLFTDKGELQPCIKKDPYFEMLYRKNPNLLKTLTLGYSAQHNFLPYLNNKAKSMDIPDEVIETKECGENFVGFKISYGRNNHQSVSNGTFQIEYTEDRELSVYNVHKVWVEYISQISKGMIIPKRKHILERVVDYAASCYYFLVSEDGESIIFGHKYTGVYPLNVPSSTFSWSAGNILSLPKFNIEYAYWFREALNMSMMAEFNMACKSSKVALMPYSVEAGHSTDAFSGMPFIDIVPGATNPFKLRWRPL